MRKTGRGSNVTRSAARYDPEKKYAGRMLQSAHRPGGTLQPSHRIVAGVMALIASAPAWAADGPAALGVPVDFILFAIMLLGVALFHRHTLYVALAGLAAITLYKVNFTGFKEGTGLAGLGAHMHNEWGILTNLLCLLLGFAL